MAKIPRQTLNNLRDFLDRGCEYLGTQEVVNDMVTEVLQELNTDCPYGDEISLFDGDDQFSSLEDFANIFWDKAVEKIMNVLETEE